MLRIAFVLLLFGCGEIPLGDEVSTYPPDGYAVGGGDTTWADEFSIIDGLGSVTAVANAGGGDIRVTSVAHGLVTGQYVRLYSMSVGAYDGEYVIQDHDDDWFDVTVAYVDTATGKWVCNLAGPDCIRFEATTPSADPYYYWEEYIDVQGGTPYRMSALVQSASIAAGNTIAVYVEWYDAGDTLLSTSYVHNAVLSAIGTWYNLSAVFTAPVTARYAIIAVGKNNTSFNAWFDDIAFAEMPPAFWTYLDASTDYGNGEVVVFDVDDGTGDTYNYGSHYDTTTGLFTAPSAGLYSFSAVLIFTQADIDLNEAAAAFLGKNGATLVAWGSMCLGFANDTGTSSVLSSGPLWLDVGDTIGVYLYETHGGGDVGVSGDVGGLPYSYFGGAKIE